MITRSKKIADLNDAFRRTFQGGAVALSHSVSVLDPVVIQEIKDAVQRYDSFAGADDPYQEHDFGHVEVEGAKFYWKIDYFALNMRDGSPDPSDPAITARVLTIMADEDY